MTKAKAIDYWLMSEEESTESLKSPDGADTGYMPISQKLESELSDSQLQVGDLVRFSEYRDMETFIFVGEQPGREGKWFYRSPGEDYYVHIPLMLSQLFPNVIDHYSEIIESEEGGAIYSFSLLPSDAWLVERYGEPLPNGLDICVGFMEGELDYILIDNQNIDEDWTREDILCWIESRNEPKSGFMLWANIDGEALRKWVKNEAREERGKAVRELLRNTSWMKQNGGCSSSSDHSYFTISFWGPSRNQESMVEAVKKIYAASNFKIEGPEDDVKICASGCDNRGGPGWTKANYWVPTGIRKEPI